MGKIKLRHGENEIELEGTDSFIKKHLEDFYSKIQSQITKKAESETTKKTTFVDISKGKKDKTPSPAEYFKSKNKTDGISQILIFAKYLENFRNTTEFARKDVNQVAKEAKLSKDINTAYFGRAVKQGLLRSLGSGKYSLTLSAEEALSSM